MEDTTPHRLLDISTNLLLELNSSGHIFYANKKAVLIWNIDWNVSDRLIDYLDPVSVSVFDNALNRVITDRQIYNFILMDHGKLYSASLYPLAYGRIAFVLEDISKCYALSKDCQKNLQRLSFAEKTAQLGYWELDIQSRKISWSAEMYRIFGISESHISSRRNLIRELVLPEDLPVYKDKLRELLTSEKTVSGTLRIHRADGEIRYCGFKADLIYEGQRRLIAGTFQDITQSIEIQNELQQAKQRAEDLSHAKSYFLAQASHDLRQPMQALKIFIATLLEENLTPQQHTLVQQIDESTNNLSSLLDNLLDISKIEAGGMEYRPEIFDIGSLINNLAGEYKALAEERHIKFIYIPLHQKVKSDPILVERMIRNLMNNAFKYTKNKILFGARNSGKEVRIQIIDNGCGIAPEDKDKIFQDFYQSSQNKNQKKQGAGLGLGIVNRIAKLLHTQIEINSILGQGSCFSFKVKKQ